jgi:tRNA threonylcarbamoyl adenosine modification protein YeaZ
MHALIIETSTERGLVAYVSGTQVLWSKELPFGYGQSKSLMPELSIWLQAANLPPFDCIGVGIGPGSYTGIRIGVAAAKALAYAWKIPLIGICTLKAFIPQADHTAFAALIDAKIGGVYILKGHIEQGRVSYSSEPAVCSLEDVGVLIKDIPLLVTPYQSFLKAKMDQICPNAQWQEVSPSASNLSYAVQAAYTQQAWSLNGQLELLYLRKTQAELEKKAS